MPKGDPNDLTWRYVTLALDRATRWAKSHDYAWQGRSCYLVSARALEYVIETRRGLVLPGGAPPVPTTNHRDQELAYADHYLHMRGMAGLHGPEARTYLEAQTRTYDNLKRNVVKALGGKGQGLEDRINRGVARVIDSYLRESAEPLSAPNADSEYWAMAGIEDGLVDYRLNPDTDNDPWWMDQYRDTPIAKLRLWLRDLPNRAHRIEEWGAGGLRALPGRLRELAD
ncbi:hypothetical protein M0638_00340 [Roseomonas sp. NAR14]|uniref:Uncharacterized protein n=1 Tax=Roseomonas acroporae TaxID=2937791 RepID=A0A9X1Y3H0_9PROT|nr:hypothetical protein [Roseomonas acroporae]MCK8782826.1 hypothetical protein [Roseomonas acroporae]